MTASSIGWTPLFLNADPVSTGTKWPASVPRRMTCLRSASLIGSSPRYFSRTSSSSPQTVSSSLCRHSSASASCAGSMSRSWYTAPFSSPSHTIAFILTRSMTPLKSASLPIGSWTTAGRRLQPRLDHLDGAEEVGAGAVHLVDEAHPRHVVLVGLAPHGLGLRLDAGDRVEHGDGAVEDAQRALDLDREVDVAGRVDDVDAVVVPERRGRRRRDRDAALLLLGHVVHDRGALVDLADLVGLAGVVEDALGRRGLARVDVGHDPDVAVSLEGILTLGHFYFTFSTVRISAHKSRSAPGPPVAAWSTSVAGTQRSRAIPGSGEGQARAARQRLINCSAQLGVRDVPRSERSDLAAPDSLAEAIGAQIKFRPPPGARPLEGQSTRSPVGRAARRQRGDRRLGRWSPQISGRSRR